MPAQEITYLGMNLSSTQFWASPKEKRSIKFRKVSSQILSTTPTFRQLEVMLGLMASMDLVQKSQLRMRPLQFRLQEARLNNALPHSRVPLSQDCRLAIRWFLQSDRLEKDISLAPLIPTLFRESDASLQGWGYRISQALSSDLWSPPHQPFRDQSYLPSSRGQQGSCLRPSFGSSRGQHHSPGLYFSRRGYQVPKLLSGSTKGSSPSRRARSLSPSIIYSRLKERPCGQPLEDRGVSGSGMVAEPQDYKALWALWGLPQVDVFATCLNRKLDLYFSPVPDPAAAGIDAFLQDWSGLNLYFFPPLQADEKGLDDLISSKETRAILIAPLWPQQTWFPDLLDLAIDHPDVCQIGQFFWFNLDHRECLRAATFNLHAWRLSSISSESRHSG